jgi:hypothetical protein
MHIIHRPSQIMQLRTYLPTLLQLALQPTKNMIERQPALPGGLTPPPPIPPRPCACIGGRLATLPLPCANENEVLPLDWLERPAGPEGEDDTFCEPCWACGCWCC